MKICEECKNYKRYYLREENKPNTYSCTRCGLCAVWGENVSDRGMACIKFRARNEAETSQLTQDEIKTLAALVEKLQQSINSEGKASRKAERGRAK